MNTKIRERIGTQGPHRILALDGGGVRGIISIAFLQDIETLLAARAVALGKVKRAEDFRLSQYFDIIGGTSVGSIIAVLLALGWRVGDIKDKFETWAEAIFKRPPYKPSFFSPKFNSAILHERVSEVLRHTPLESKDLQTVLAVIAKRVDEGSPWVMTNNPLSAFWDDKAETGTIGNRHYKLADLICASTAAPYYFAPRTVQIDPVRTGLFADGGVSPHNNPALQLFMMASIKGYKFGWELGADKLLVISVGTGSHRVRVGSTLLNRLVPSLFAVGALQGLIADSQTLSLALLQWMSRSRVPWEINSEVGTLVNDDLFASAGLEKPMLSFCRYDVPLEHKWLEGELGKFVSARSLQFHRAFDDPANIVENYKLAKLAAAKQVSDDDFPAAFDGWGR